MRTFLTRTKLTLVIFGIAAAAAPAGAAFAGEPGTTTRAVSSAPGMPDVGQSYVPSPADPGIVTFGGLLPPTSGGQGARQSANSLPPGFLDGTPAMQRRQELQRYWAEQAR